MQPGDSIPVYAFQRKGRFSYPKLLVRRLVEMSANIFSFQTSQVLIIAIARGTKSGRTKETGTSAHIAGVVADTTGWSDLAEAVGTRGKPTGRKGEKRPVIS